MTQVIDDWNILNELITLVRNWDIFTVSQRGVTTTSDNGTWTAATSHLINRTNVRNIRSITVDASSLTYGLDYQVDYTFDDSGTCKCKLTLTSAQTGDYVVQYDYGTDKIFTEAPKGQLKITSFPRIVVDLLQSPSRPAGLGNVNESDKYIRTRIYGTNRKSVEGYNTAIRTKMIESQSGVFYYMKGPVRPVGTGPWIPAPENFAKQEVFMKVQDYISVFNYEKNN